MKLISLVYDSTASAYFSDAELTALLHHCRENNSPLGITGLLLYKCGSFMQILEGEVRAVEKLYSKIEKDPRHHRCNLVRWEKIRERSFPVWSMGFRNLDNPEVSQTPGYSEFMNDGLTSDCFRSDPSRAQKLLLLFRNRD